MALRTKKYSFFGQEGFGGGLVSENPITLSKNQMVIADNILVGTVLSRRKRGGQVKYHTGTFDTTGSYPASGVPIRGILDFWRTASLAGNPVSNIFLHQGAKVWSVASRSSIAVDRTGALTISPLGIPSYQPFNQRLYFCSSITSDGYNKWDGNSASSAVATPPPDGVGKILTAHFGRMVMAGQNDFPFTAYLSSEFDPEDWSTSAPSNATSLQVDDRGDPQGITGLCSFQGRLYIFCRRSIYEVTGNDPASFIVTPISTGIGCLSHGSIVQVPNDIIFASDRGIHSLRQVASGRQSESSFLSRDIQKLWVTLLNTALYGQVQATYDDTTNNYVITVPTSGQVNNDQMLCYNIEFGTWTVWPNINARSLNMVLLSNKRNILLGKEDGKIALINQNVQTDFDQGFTARFLTGVLYPGGLDVEKRFKSITIIASTTVPSQFTIGWTIDGKKSGLKAIDLTAGEDLLGTTFVLGQSRLGVGQYLPHTVSIDDVGYGIQVDMIAGGTSDIEVYGFILEVEDVNPNFT